MSLAQKQTASIVGQIVDSQGNPVDRVQVYLDSPALMAAIFYIAPSSGLIHFDLLPPGTYSIRTEIPGYKAVNAKNLVLELGQILNIKIILEKSEIEEEETKIIPSRTLNPRSHKTSVIVERDAVETLPLQRNIMAASNTAPGLIQGDTLYPGTQIIHGSTARSNLYSMDGLILDDPTGRQLITEMPYDAIDQIEIVTAGHSAATPMADGGYINVITRSGGNAFHSSFLIQHTSDGFIRKLRSNEEISKLGVQPPDRDMRLWDFSLTLGTDLWPDRVWFFSSLNWTNTIRSTPFVSWKDPQGINHPSYDWKDDQKTAFAKLTLQPYSMFNLSGTFYFTDRKQINTAQSLAWNLASDAAFDLNHDRKYIFSGTLSYFPDQSTSILLNAGYLQGSSPEYLKGSQISSPSYYDDLLGYSWGSAPFNDRSDLKKFHARLILTRYFSSHAGFDAVLNAGLNYDYNSVGRNIWKENNLQVHYLNGSPYFFGMKPSPLSGNPVGAGKISFNFASAFENGFASNTEVRNISMFLSDSVTFANRFTLNLGLRFDRSIGHLPGQLKSSIGNAVGLKIGEELIKPIAGENLYADAFLPEWKNLVTWNSFSPHAGLILDLFGNSRTLIKGSFARYYETPSLQLLNTLNPLSFDRSYDYFWYDEDMNGEVDTDDNYTLFPDDYGLFKEGFYTSRLDENLAPPHTDEFTASVQQEIASGFSLQITYIHKNMSNIIENVLMDRENGQYWYTKEQDTQNWWVPFSTIVPGSGDYTETPVTVYFPSKNAPLYFDQIKNVPELKRTYRALEFTISKQMSHNWMLHGSLVLSRSTGNIGLGYAASSGMTQAAYNPNSFVNSSENARLDYDRPLVIKLMGTFRFPWGLMLSTYYRHLSGAPWARSVTIVPPQDWADTHNTRTEYMQVLLEEPGSRRLKAMNILDMRMEKSFALSQRGKLSLRLDVLNALSSKYSLVLNNDAGYWFPSTENSNQGTRLISSYFNRIIALKGTKTFMFSMCLGF